MKCFLTLVVVIGSCATGYAEPIAKKNSNQLKSQSAEQFIFPKSEMNIGNQRIHIEIADTPVRRERGLMFREQLAENQGMLFVFDEPQVLGFWMRNTLIPLSIGYFDADQKLIEVMEMVPASDLDQNPPIYRSSRPAKFALEMQPNWFTKKGIKPGTRFQLEPKKSTILDKKPKT